MLESVVEAAREASEFQHEADEFLEVALVFCSQNHRLEMVNDFVPMYANPLFKNQNGQHAASKTRVPDDFLRQLFQRRSRYYCLRKSQPSLGSRVRLNYRSMVLDESVWLSSGADQFQLYQTIYSAHSSTLLLYLFNGKTNR